MSQQDYTGVGVSLKELAALGTAKSIGLTQIDVGHDNLSRFQPHAAYRIKG